MIDGIDPDTVSVEIGLGRNQSITTKTDISGVEIKLIAIQNKYWLESASGSQLLFWTILWDILLFASLLGMMTLDVEPEVSG